MKAKGNFRGKYTLAFGQDPPLHPPISPIRIAAVSIKFTHNHPSTATSRFVFSFVSSKPELRYQGLINVVS